MIYFADAAGSILQCMPERVYQGSAEGSKICLIGPFSADAEVAVYFGLPDGSGTEPCPMEWVRSVEGYTDEAGNALSGWEATVPACVTEKFGLVRVQFAVRTAGEYSLTAAAHFTVERGVAPALPAEPQQDIYGQILASLSGVRGDLSNGYFASRSLYQWNATYTYGVGELVFYAEEGENGALVRSVAAGNQGNPPYVNGVLDSGHWAEAVPFGEALAAAENAHLSAGAAQSAVSLAMQHAEAAEESSQMAASSEAAAEQSAYQAQQAKAGADSFASAAQGSANAAAASAALAQSYAEIGIQPNTDYTTFDSLPRPGSTKFIYLIPFQGSAANDAYNEYIWVPENQQYEFIGSTRIDLTGYAQTSGNYPGMSVGSASSAVNAENATKSVQDGNGEVIADTYAKKHTPSGGFVAGENASAYNNGIAIGLDAFSQNGGDISIGAKAQATGSDTVAVGTGASVATTALYSVAIGKSAKVSPGAENSVQLGTGTNATANTLQFQDYPLVDAAGNIPAQRLLSLYPVGAYYITESETTPASLFGGSWARVSGYFLYGAALQTSVGITGGEIEHTLTVSEIPSHEHVIYLQPNTGSYNGVGFYTNGGGYNDAFAEKAYLYMNGQGGAAHNNMPPYRQVNIWRRTA